VSASDHWLDRLAVRLTRRQTLKAAVAASVALPLVRTRAAKADPPGPGACKKGCYWSSHQYYNSEGGRCLVRANGRFDAALVLFPFTLGLSFTTLGTDPVGNFTRCVDNASLSQKQQQLECQQPGCGDFDPRGPYGPCAGLSLAYNCCPCGAADQGYIPCVFDCNDPNHDCCPAS
jgi:hypothetical protein